MGWPRRTFVSAALLFVVSSGLRASGVESARLVAQDVRKVPALPRVRAHIEGRLVIGRYEFASWPSDPQTRPWQILVSSLSSDSRYAPATYYVYPHSRTGRIRQHLTLGRGPYKLLVSVRNRFGGRSKVITTPLRRLR